MSSFMKNRKLTYLLGGTALALSLWLNIQQAKENDRLQHENLIYATDLFGARDSLRKENVSLAAMNKQVLMAEHQYHKMHRVATEYQDKYENVLYKIEDIISQRDFYRARMDSAHKAFVMVQQEKARLQRTLYEDREFYKDWLTWQDQDMRRLYTIRDAYIDSMKLLRTQLQVRTGSIAQPHDE